eukprot:CAMPEP_0172513216 /NCGR_PEP_ID=MMETSP1066-20121228/250649_1 /TAXON_ID=671091 /ORGANISM="Coscinodiscus wailesii, Strain CCMP2513" /LENGTH=362 /DNA_ID=CAMNT_0013293383 /DNA_START=197 /DNA_END=1285 /DNA_ORIENTATION=+
MSNTESYHEYIATDISAKPPSLQKDETRNEHLRHFQRVWKPGPEGKSTSSVWINSISDEEADCGSLNDALERIKKQEIEGGRMRQRQKGVLRADPTEDMRLLIQNYTVPALASALRDREETLQLCATLLSENNISSLQKILEPYRSENVLSRRTRKNQLDLSRGFGDRGVLEMLRKGLTRLPRRVTQGYLKRAGVVLPLCDVEGVPCLLFEKRSKSLRAHPDEVCLPGGMVSTKNDKTIISTCLREMYEEINGLDPEKVIVLGILRCNWGEVAQLTGVAVTPVVCYLGEIGGRDLSPNEDEVAECFTVPLESILDKNLWIHKDDSAPIFTGGPHIIWGLTGYILDRFVGMVRDRYSVHGHVQ